MKKFLALVLCLVLCSSVFSVLLPVSAAGETWQALDFGGTVTEEGDTLVYTCGSHFPNAWTSPQWELLPALKQALGENKFTVMTVSFSVKSRGTNVTLRPLLRGKRTEAYEKAGIGAWSESYKKHCLENGAEPLLYEDVGGNVMLYLDSAVSVSTSSWTPLSFTLLIERGTLDGEFLTGVRLSFDSISNPASLTALEIRDSRLSFESTPGDYGVASLKDEIGTPENSAVRENLLPASSASFDSAASVSATGWTVAYGGGSCSLSLKDEGPDGSRCLYFTKPADAGASFYTPALNLAPFITKAGVYTVSFRYQTNAPAGISPFAGVFRGDKAYSFIDDRGGSYYTSLANAPAVESGTWGTFSDSFTVTDTDVSRKNVWNLCLHLINASVSEIRLDDFSLTLEPEGGPSQTYTWVATEFTFYSSKEYADPLCDAEMDMVLTNGSTTLTVPAFWDGGTCWRVRAALPQAGAWTYTTACTDQTNTGLNGRTGSIFCQYYTGKLDIYKRGFVRASGRNFAYADGTPFFYLGDTHWNLGRESAAMMETIASRRAAQGYTVIQSEPLSVGFRAADGISTADIAGFRAFDTFFEIIADKGLVHANAELFFPSDMQTFINNFGGFSAVSLGSAGGKAMYDLSDTAKAMLRRLTRYWAARYSAYPVMWTLGQETDDDFYWDRGDHPSWSYVNQPYRLMAEYLAAADPYKHPLTSHQEHVSHTACSDSAFRNTPAHTWWGVQWSQSYNQKINFAYPRDFWVNGQNKPAVLYEGKYCYLWTKNFGARVQGYMAFLDGMFGYGWGAQDTWDYLATYDENTTTNDGVDSITAFDKSTVTWESSLNFSSAYQMGYMRRFFENVVGDWQTLVPRFDDTSYFAPASGTMSIHASNDAKTKFVTYFYNFSDSSLASSPNSNAANAKHTGTLKGLKAGSAYQYLWFSPVTGLITGRGSFTASSSGTWTVPEKGPTDMVLYVYSPELIRVDVSLPDSKLPVGTTPEENGLCVTATYAGGETRVLKAGEYSVSGFNKDVSGIQCVSFSYTENGTVRSTYQYLQTVPAGLRGDLDGNGVVDSADLTRMARLVARIETATDRDTATGDLDGDSLLTANDLTILARYVARIISEL